MRFFISSTFEDLKEYRKYTIEYLNNLIDKKTGKIVAMEFFAASEKDSKEVCLAELEKSDLVIGIYGQRFGYEPDGTGRSMTEIEFDRARELKIPVLKLVSYQEKEEKQERFINEKILVPGGNCGRFNSLEDFADVLHTSVKVYFEFFEGYSYESIWDDIKLMRKIIAEEIQNSSLRMDAYQDGDAESAIEQILDSANWLIGMRPSINEMYNKCANLDTQATLFEISSTELNINWESVFMGIPNHLSSIRLAASFLKISYLQQRLLTEKWTEELRQKIIRARDFYIEIMGDSYYID